MWYPGASVTLAPGQQVTDEHGDKYLIQAVVNVLKRNRVIRLYCLGIDEDSN